MAASYLLSNLQAKNGIIEVDGKLQRAAITFLKLIFSPVSLSRGLHPQHRELSSLFYSLLRILAWGTDLVVEEDGL